MARTKYPKGKFESGRAKDMFSEYALASDNAPPCAQRICERCSHGALGSLRARPVTRVIPGLESAQLESFTAFEPSGSPQLRDIEPASN